MSNQQAMFLLKIMRFQVEIQLEIVEEVVTTKTVKIYVLAAIMSISVTLSETFCH